MTFKVATCNVLTTTFLGAGDHSVLPAVRPTSSWQADLDTLIWLKSLCRYVEKSRCQEPQFPRCLPVIGHNRILVITHVIPNRG
jgi:hypothetical protein